ncbi:MAG: hypothetical protein ACYCST_09990 [Acidimicrobiales bacterium]
MLTDDRRRRAEGADTMTEKADLDLAGPDCGELRRLVAARGDLDMDWDGTLRERNNQRAVFAAIGVMAFADRVYGNCVDDEPSDQTIADLIADLRHLADGLGLDWDHLCGWGEGHYETEIEDDQA